MSYGILSRNHVRTRITEPLRWENEFIYTREKLSKLRTQLYVIFFASVSENIDLKFFYIPDELEKLQSQCQSNLDETLILKAKLSSLKRESDTRIAELLEELRECRKLYYHPLLKRTCNNKEDLYLEDLDFSVDNMIMIINIVSPDRYVSDCYVANQLPEALSKHSRVYKWRFDPSRPRWRGEAILDEPVFALPNNGVYIDKMGFEMIKRRYNTLVLRLVEKKVYLGSSFGMSQMHGTEEDRRDIYTLKPINRLKFLRKEKITEEDIKNFKVTFDDLVR